MKRPRRHRKSPSVWKLLVGLFFLLVIFDGALRKWVLPSYSVALYALKDVVLWCGFLAFAVRRRVQLPRPVRRTALPFLLGAYVFIVLVQAANFHLPNLTVAALGLKAHLAYLPLLVLVPALLVEATRRQVVRLLRGYALFIYLPIAALGVYQFFQPPSHWINQYVREMGTIATASGHTRITGTFSYITGFTSFLRFNAFLAAGVLLAGLYSRDKEFRWIGLFMVAVTAIILPMTGSRAPVIIAAAGVFVLLAIVSLQRGRSVRLVLAAVVVAGGLMLASNLTGIGQGWAGLAERTARAGGRNIERAVATARGPLRGIDVAGLMGFGVGSAHQAAPRFVPGAYTHTWLPDGYVEAGTARIVIELGAVGYLILLALKAVLVLTAYRALRRSVTPVELMISAAAFCLLLAGLVFPVIFNVVTGAFYWGAAGAVIGVWSLQQVRGNEQEPRHQRALSTAGVG